MKSIKTIFFVSGLILGFCHLPTAFAQSAEVAGSSQPSSASVHADDPKMAEPSMNNFTPDIAAGGAETNPTALGVCSSCSRFMPSGGLDQSTITPTGSAAATGTSEKGSR